MAIKKKDLEQELKRNLDLNLKFKNLKPMEQAEILNRCSTVADAKKMIAEKAEEPVFLSSGTYSAETSVSGNNIAHYRSKQLFDALSNFEEEDIEDFISCAEDSFMNYSKNFIADELRIKMKKMMQKNCSPLQCMVYATKSIEKKFYSNSEVINLWGKVIAEHVEKYPEEVYRINYMLINWKMWKEQILLLLQSSIMISENKQNAEYLERLSTIIRDEYGTTSEEKLRFTVLQYLLKGCRFENYTCAFRILKKVNFIKEVNKKYYRILEEKVRYASNTEMELLFQAYQNIAAHGFGEMESQKCRWIESLLKGARGMEIIEYINQAAHNEQQQVLEEVQRILDNPEQASNFYQNLKEITQFRSEIQTLFQRKLLNHNGSLNIGEIKSLSFSLLNMDREKGLSILKQLAQQPRPQAEKLVYQFVLANYNENNMSAFVSQLLDYQEKEKVIPFVKSIKIKERQQQFAEILYQKLKQISVQNGFASKEFKTAMNNIGIFMRDNTTSDVYSPMTDSLLFSFLGYHEKEGTFDRERCTSQNLTRVFFILDNIMTKQNYKERYMQFMQALFYHFKNVNVSASIQKDIETRIRRMTGEGLPDIMKIGG